ncbi:MAG: hypothetical protein ACK4K2_03825 [Dehalococcoidia bacterium]
MNPPQKMCFPDGKEAPINSWRSLLRETAKWLDEQGKLPPRGKAYIELYVSAQEAVRRAVRLIQAAGLDPERFLVLPV